MVLSDIEDSVQFVLTAYPLLVVLIVFFGFREIRRSLSSFASADRVALALVFAVASGQLITHWHLVNDFWGPGFQNWKFECNGVMFTRLKDALFDPIHHHGSSFLMMPFLLLFGAHHTSVIYMNSVLFVLLAVAVFMAAREIFSSWKAGLAAGLLLPFYDPLTALWLAGGEYLAAFAIGTAATWLFLRNVREKSIGSFVMAALLLQLGSMIRMEIIFLWVVWFFAAFVEEGYSRRMQTYIFIFGALSLMVSSLAFDNFFTPFPRRSSQELLTGIDAYLFHLADGWVVLIASCAGLYKLLHDGKSSAYGLLFMLMLYGFMILPSPSSDKYQLSVYMFIPLCVMAGGAALYLPQNLRLFFPVLLFVLTINAAQHKQCLFKSIEVERGFDISIRRLVETLPGDMKLFLNPAYSEIALGPERSVYGKAADVDSVMKKLAGAAPFACFHPVYQENGCAFIELFRDVRRVALESLPSLEPLNYGCSVLESRRDSDIEMRIYQCPADSVGGRAVAP